MKTTPEQRQQWREVADAATPGPWRYEIGDYDKGRGHIMTAAPVAESWTKSPLLCSHLFGADDDANFSLMAAARTAVSALLDDVAELDAEVDRLREKVSDMRSERVRADEKHKEEVERLKAALTEACDIAALELDHMKPSSEAKACRIAELRKAGGK